MENKIKVGIVGGAGYTAGELLRILLNHPIAEIKYINSTSNAGNFVYDVHKDLVGETELKFTDIDYTDVDVIYLCMGHGKSQEFVESNDLPADLKIIDLSTDYRMKGDHDFVYGLPEAFREDIKSAKYIANPGCFATGIQMTILPLAANSFIVDDIHVNGVTGSTGAGQAPSATTHFSWRNGNVSLYKAFTHQHLNEIGQTLTTLQPSFEQDVNFIPVRGNYTRGILISMYTKCALSIEMAYKLYEDYYKDHPFVHVQETNPDLKQVINTNKCIVHLEKHGDNLLVISISDNLIKGASGQAVQNMNLMFGLEEKTGLYLKPVGF